MWLPLCSNAYDDVTDFDICGFHKTQKTGYLKNETLFFLQIKKLINYTLSTFRAPLWVFSTLIIKEHTSMISYAV